ncbi:MAG: HAD family hydrolase [Pseudomonadales bacterium]
MSVQALVFDFGGVISKTMFETHALTERELGLAAGTLTWRGPFDPAGDEVWRAMQADEISERDYWLHRARETGALLSEQWSSMQEFVIRARGANPLEIIRPEFLNCIERAEAAGVRLAILSNELDLFYGADLRHKLPFMSRFEQVVDATYTEILKPDPRAYQQIFDGLQLAPEQCLFIDDQARNIKGAEACGMRTQWFDVLDPSASYAAVIDQI